MIDFLTGWRPNTWPEYALLYIAPGALMVSYLLIKTFLEKPSDFARGVMKVMGKEESWIDKIKEIIVFSLAIACVLIGWPAFLVWLIKDKLDRAGRQKRYDEPDFNCSPEYLVAKVHQIDAEIASYVIDPLGAVPPLPFGHLNRGWINFLSGLTDDRDEIWSFYIPKGNKHGKYRFVATGDIRGYAKVRNGKVLGEFITESD